MSRPRLDALLKPRSIAVVGASATPGTVGNTLVRHLLAGGYKGEIFPVNPKGGAIEGLRAYESFAALPAPVEHAAFAIADTRIEAAFDAALARGIKAATILGALALPGDGGLRARIKAKADAHGVAICGANCMGFYNFLDGVHLCGFSSRDTLRPGSIALMTHAGSLFGALIDCDERLDYSFAISPGQELNVTLADYMDYALERAETRVVGLFMETARDPRGFRDALGKAAARGVPVVALKIGRARAGAALAQSHSGALVGDDGAYEAVFAHYGVHRVRSIEEMAFTLMMFAQPRRPARGGLVSIHDSGGERGLMADLAQDHGVPFAALSPRTVARLEDALDPGLPAVNPLDAWGTGHDYQAGFTRCLAALMQDDDAALGAIVIDRMAGGAIAKECIPIVSDSGALSGKPLFLVSNHQGSGASADAVALTRQGFPVIDSLPGFLMGARHLLDHRDYVPPVRPEIAPPRSLAHWQARLRMNKPWREAEALSLLADFGVPCASAREASLEAEVLAAARALGYPVALKTASGLAHKSDAGGVVLNVRGEAALLDAYRTMRASLGPRVTVARMIAEPAAEMLLGMVHDAQFGPIVTIGMGGIHAELLRDRVTLLPPFCATDAARAIEALKLRPLLDGARGAPPCDVEAFCAAAAAFSQLAARLGPLLETVDVNPVRVTQTGAVAVDALILPRRDIP